MFGSIGGLEILVILVVALLVLGPDHLPRVMRTLGRTVGELRRVSTEFQRTVNTGLALEDEHAVPENAAGPPEKTALSSPPLSAAPKTAAGKKRIVPKHRPCRIGIKTRKEKEPRTVDAAGSGNAGDTTGAAPQSIRDGKTRAASVCAPGMSGGVSGSQKKKPYRPAKKIKPALRKSRKNADKGAA